MNHEETQTEEIIIVGSRYGELADVVNPLYEQGLPIEPEDIKEKLGGDVVYLMPINNSHDAYAVGAYTLSQKRIGHVWMHQAPALRQWLDENHKKYMCAHIRRMNTQYRLMMATPDKPMKLEACERSMMGYDPDWAKNLPEELKSITAQSLSLGMALLHDELEEAEAWSPRLQQRIDNLLRNLPSDLSAHHYRESMELYEMMKASKIAEVRQQSDVILHAFVSRGSEEQMRWWMNCWLPDFFRETAESDLLGLFEAANYTLDDVESLLRRAPENLFYLYKANRFRFVNHLYYSALPQNIYNRLLTLLAVREAMLGKKEGRQTSNDCSEPLTATDRKPDLPPADVFVNRVKAIVLEMAKKNGETIPAKPRGQAAEYVFFVDGERLAKMMDDLRKNHEAKINEFLCRHFKSNKYDGVMTVAPFIGGLLKMEDLRARGLQLADLEFAFVPYYNNPASAVRRLSEELKTDEAKMLYSLLVGLQKKYSKS